MFPFTLSSSVGIEEENHPSDVVQTSAALATLGHFEALGAFQSGNFDDGLDKSIRTYQSENALEPDGVLLPNGPTQSSLNNALRVHRPGPSLLSVNDDAEAPTLGTGDQSRNLAPNDITRTSPKVLRHRDSMDAVVQDGWGRRDADTPASDLRATKSGAPYAATSEHPPFRAATGAEIEQIMKLNAYRYVPDPMGRLNRGDWVNEVGERVSSDAAEALVRNSQTTASRKDVDLSRGETEGAVTVASRSPAVLHPIASDFDRLSYDLETATNRVKRGQGQVRIAVAVPRSREIPPAEIVIPQINAAVREAFVTNALIRRSTSPDEIAAITREMIEHPERRPRDGRSRVKDMLIEATLNAATPEQRLHARGLLAVYEMEEREATHAGDVDPRSRADSALAQFGAALDGDVSWAVYDPTERQGEEGIELVDDDPNKPRGSQHPTTRSKAAEGRRTHATLSDFVKGKGRGWKADFTFVDTNTGKVYRFDVRTPIFNGRFYILELKPDTPTGRAQGEKQCAEYTRVTKMPCRVIYYTPSSNATPSTRAPMFSRGGMAGTPRLRLPQGAGGTPRPMLPRMPFDFF